MRPDRPTPALPPAPDGVSPSRHGDLARRTLARPAPSTQPALPTWAIAAMIALAVLAVASVGVAIVAISL